MKEALVSVCIPVYNGEKTIKDTLNSVISQTYKNLEIIVVDNASTDSTVEKIREVSDDRIKLYQNKENLGMVGNWNKALEYVSGDYIHFLCADDVMLPTCVEKKIKFAEKHQDLVLITNATAVVDENDNRLLERHLARKDVVYDGKKLAKRAYRTRNLYGEPSTILFKTSTINDVGTFAENVRYGTDLEMWIRISCEGQVGYLDEVLALYRVSTSNETSSFGLKGILDDDKEMLKNLNSYKKLNVSVTDKLIHHIMYFLRAVARNVYMKIQSKKNGV